MPSRTDLLHSYQFRSRRVLSALVMRETDPSQSPLRRGVGAVFAGIMVAILAGAGFGIYGLVSRVGGDAWRTPGAVVVERETGATYVYRDGVLYPTLNLASAMLAGGRPNPTVHRIASASLQDLGRGVPIGIPGAPDSLPAANRQIGLPWTVCAGREADSGAEVPRVALAVGVGATGGTVLGDRALIVRDPAVDWIYLVWHGHRYRIASLDTSRALFGEATLVDAGTAWINAMPAGLDIAPILVSGRGTQSDAVPAYRNGDVLRLPTADQHYLVLNDGLVPLTELQYAVQDADRPITAIDVRPADVDVPTSALAPTGPAETLPPAQRPTPLPVDGSDLICATTPAGSPAPEVRVGGTVDGLDRAVRTTGTAAGGVPLANRVLVPAGRVSVIRAVATAGAPTGSYLVVTDLGIAYPVSDPEVLLLLGYSPAQAVEITTSLAALLPTGPVLDPAAAVLPQTLSEA